jgi:hypothetical protein
MRAHRNCQAMTGLLQRTQWSGAPACLEMVGQIDFTIAGLYNKAESAFAPGEASSPAGQGNDGASEPPPAPAEEHPDQSEPKEG